MTNVYPNIPVLEGRKAAKSFVKYDHYLLDSSREIFKDDSKPLREYLKMKAMVATTPCMSVREGRLLLPGEDLCRYRERVSTEYGKKFTRSLLKVFWMNEQNHECLSDFDVKNIFVSHSGKAKLQGVIRMKHNGVQAKRNYDSARSVLIGIYSKGGVIPKDIQHLLNLVEKYPLKSGLYHIHASLVPLSKRQPSYFKMYEQLMYMMDDLSRDKIFLELPYSEDWKKRIGGNRLLKRIYDFNPKMYEVTDSTQQQNPPTFDEKLASEKKRKRDESSRMAKFLRHRTAPRMDEVKKENGGYHAEDSELVALVHLPLVHPFLQESLYDAGKLQDLHFNELF